ncbi:hypothetical protein [Streptomyces sp. NPDC002088]|uniref:hypothetical protein n=1 Tax=Streptomyces sp. NPDC002088 TaxID=3154665 RepID=UPI00331BC431
MFTLVLLRNGMRGADASAYGKINLFTDTKGLGNVRPAYAGVSRLTAAWNRGGHDMPEDPLPTHLVDLVLDLHVLDLLVPGAGSSNESSADI